MSITKRDIIRNCLSEEPALTVGQVVSRTKLDQKAVATLLSALRRRTGEVSYFKLKGDFGRYTLRHTRVKVVKEVKGTKDILLNLAQL